MGRGTRCDAAMRRDGALEGGGKPPQTCRGVHGKGLVAELEGLQAAPAPGSPPRYQRHVAQGKAVLKPPWQAAHLLACTLLAPGLHLALCTAMGKAACHAPIFCIFPTSWSLLRELCMCMCTKYPKYCSIVSLLFHDYLHQGTVSIPRQRHDGCFAAGQTHACRARFCLLFARVSF